MTHQKGNELIAEFMGAKFDPEWRFLDKPENPIQPTWVFQEVPTKHSCSNWGTDQLMYHEDWNWLMPVVEKIENLDAGRGIYLVNIEGQYCSIKIHDETEWLICSTEFLESSSKIDAVWRTVVKFIQNLNVNKSNQYES